MRTEAQIADNLTEGQREQVRIGGIPADRPGLLGEYPKMVYRKGGNAHHIHLNEPLKVQGAYNLETALVDDAEDEAQALADGWALSPDLQAEQKRADLITDQAAEIERLQAELAAAQKSRGGRPRKEVAQDGEENVEQDGLQDA